MASDPTPASNEQQGGGGATEDEPLLGRAGDASQQDGKPMQFNLVLGILISILVFLIV